MTPTTSALALVHSRDDMDLAKQVVVIAVELGAHAAVLLSRDAPHANGRGPVETVQSPAGQVAGRVIGAHGSPLVMDFVGRTFTLKRLEEQLSKSFESTIAVLPCAPQGKDPVAHFAIVGLADPESLLPLLAVVGEILSQFRQHHALGERIAKLEEELATANAQIARHEDRDRLIIRDLYDALCFQRAMLPRTRSLPGVELDVMFLPAEIVSGDIYDVTVVRGDIVRLFVADAAGHGVAAALATMFIKSQYDQLKHGSKSPAELLTLLNDAIAAYGRADMRFTAICLDLRRDTGNVVYASAAHPAPLLVDGPTPRWLGTGGTFVGMTAHVAFPERELTLNRGATLYVITDGLVEATDPAQATFGEGRVAAELAIAAREAEPAELRLVPALAAFVGEGRSLSDDVTLVGIRLV